MAIKATWNDKVEFHVGDTIKLDYKIEEEGKKARTQPFEGQVIAISGDQENRMFRVRKMAADQIGVERIFPLNSPWIKNLEVVKKPKRKTRRAKLYYTRQPRSKKKKKKRK
jgi:large subunit ribosomal protein L19